MASGIQHKRECTRPEPLRRVEGNATVVRCPMCQRAAMYDGPSPFATAVPIEDGENDG